MNNKYESLFNLLFSNTHDKVLLLNRDKKILDINLPFLNEYALIKQNLIGQSFHDLCTQIELDTSCGLVDCAVDDICYIYIEKTAEKNQTEFIANMSHDLRTPITGILGLAQSLKEEAENEGYRDDANLLIDTTTELLQILNEAIEVVHLEKGQPKTTEIFSIQQLCEHNIALLKPAAKHKKLQLQIELSDEIPNLVQGNRIYLDRCLLNLLSNAIKFTHAGVVKLTVTLDSIENNVAQINFKVIDTGIGMSESQYQQPVPSPQGIYNSNGLGLYAVKQYIKALHGRLSLQSSATGTIFCIQIPLIVIASIHQKNNFLESLLNSEVKISNPSAHILVVENSDLAAYILRETLERCQCTCDLASIGQQAIDLVKIRNYDLILLNIGLPDTDGIQVAKQIHQLSSTIPIIAMSVHLSQDKKQFYKENGIHELIVKPITLKILQKILNKYSLINTTSTAIDLQDGANHTNGNLSAAKELLVLMSQTLTNDVHQIKNFYQQQNFTELYRIVHKFYGGLCYCGVPRLRELTKELERSLMEKKYDNIEYLINSIANEATTVLHEIKKI